MRTTAAGDSLLSPSVTSRVIARATRQRTPDREARAKLAELTPRELEVLTHFGQGLSNVEIAGTLVVEDSTVKTHVKRILAKLEARDCVQAVLFAQANALQEPRRDR